MSSSLKMVLATRNMLLLSLMHVKDNGAVVFVSLFGFVVAVVVGLLPGMVRPVGVVAACLRLLQVRVMA